MGKQYIILGHENPDVDSIVSGFLLEKLLNKMGIGANFVIPDLLLDSEQVNICKSFGLDPKSFQKEFIDTKDNLYILVDHHERKLKGDIVGVIDHHPTVKTLAFPYYQNELISSTACLICQGREENFSDEELTLAVMATFVDTASFHSTKALKKDLDWAMQLIRELNLDFDLLYQLGLCLTSLEEISYAALHGLKQYSFHQKKVASSYIQIQNVEQNKEIIFIILSFLQKYLMEQELDLFAFLVHDMDQFQTILYRLRSNDITKTIYLTYTSRGSTIMPEIEKLFSQTKE